MLRQGDGNRGDFFHQILTDTMPLLLHGSIGIKPDGFSEVHLLQFGSLVSGSRNPEKHRYSKDSFFIKISSPACHIRYHFRHNYIVDLKETGRIKCDVKSQVILIIGIYNPLLFHIMPIVYSATFNCFSSYFQFFEKETSDVCPMPLYGLFYCFECNGKIAATF